MPLTFDHISFQEIPGSGVLSFDGEGKGKATMLFKVAWDDRIAFMRKMLGLGETITSNHRGVVQHYPDFPILIAASCRALPHGRPKPGSDDFIDYDKAVIEVEFTTPEFNLPATNQSGAEEYISADLDFYTEFIPLDNEFYKWADTSGPNKDLKLAKEIGLVLGGTSHEVTIHRKTSFVAADIQAAIGRVNSVAFRGIAAEKLLLTKASIPAAQTGDDQGFRTYKLHMTFLQRDESWNQVVRLNAAGTALEWKDVIPDPFLQVDFNGLITST